MVALVKVVAGLLNEINWQIISFFVTSPAEWEQKVAYKKSKWDIKNIHKV